MKKTINFLLKTTSLIAVLFVLGCICEDCDSNLHHLNIFNNSNTAARVVGYKSVSSSEVDFDYVLPPGSFYEFNYCQRKCDPILFSSEKIEIYSEKKLIYSEMLEDYLNDNNKQGLYSFDSYIEVYNSSKEIIYVFPLFK